MSDLKLRAYADHELALTARREGDDILIAMTGNADINAIAPLTAFLEQLHREATRIAARTVRIDLAQLEFMSSSCLKSFVTWISGVAEAAPAQQYQIRFLSNPELRWQRRSLLALSCFAADLVSVES